MPADVYTRFPRSPGLWPQPTPLPELPSASMRMYPASPGMWAGQLDAHEAGLRALAATGDAAAAASLQSLRGDVLGALAGNPQSQNDAAVLDWVAGRFPG